MTESAHYFKAGKLKDKMASVCDHIPTESVTEWEKHLEILILFHGLTIKTHSSQCIELQL